MGARARVCDARRHGRTPPEARFEECSSMCFIAAIGTGKAGRPTRSIVEPRRSTAAQRCSFVEDLNWPAPSTTPQKKPRRPVEVWVPGPIGSWEGIVPRIE
jgi:hypothetical protein